MLVTRRKITTVLALAAALTAPPTAWAGDEHPVKVLHTPSGVRFGLLGDKGVVPVPTLFVFAGSVEGTLGSDDYNKVGRLLGRAGTLCVALDLPCHGDDVKKDGEPAGLDGWAARLRQGDDLVPGFVTKATAVLDYLVREKYTDPHRVAACGTSRGGFMALHFAAAERRVRCVATFAPVTDLLALREFAGLEKHAPTRALALAGSADKLADRALWLCIGNHDERVGTDLAIAFTRKVVEEAAARHQPANVELHVMPTVGHAVHATAHDEAAAWIERNLKDSQ
jgi:dienelactone hydrolase